MTKISRQLTVFLGVGFGWLCIAASISSAQLLDDPALQVQQLVMGLSSPTTMAFIGPNDILVLQKNDGRVRRVINGVLQAGQVLDVAVDGDSEHGLLGIALHPSFPATPSVYLYYTESGTGSDTDGPPDPAPLGNRVYRYTWNGSALINPSLILSLPVTPGPNHNGGVIAFGPDGKLYVVIGDLNRSGQLQNHATGAAPDDTSVILRLNDDGTIPADNPFHAQGGNLAKYFAYGIRNSFGLAFDPVTNKLWMTENGPNTYDEINRVDAGFNSGWNQIMGPDARDSQGIGDLFQVTGSHYGDPKFSWLDTVGPTGIVFFNSAQLGVEYQNNVFVGDINNGTLYRFKPNAARNGFDFVTPGLGDLVADSGAELDEVIFGTGFGGITDVKVGPDGLLYVLGFSQGKIYVISRPGGAADLIETAVSIPSAAAPGASFVVTDTVKNQGPAQAGASTTRHYLSLDAFKDATDLLLSHTRGVPLLAAGATSTGTAMVTIPSGTALGPYYLLACADDTNIVTESDDTNNCLASPATLLITRPDMIELSVSNPPAFGLPGGSFSVSDTAKNNGVVGTKGSTTRYYLSLDTSKGSGDKLMGGGRGVPALAAGASSNGTVNMTIPSTTALATYHLLACADDTSVIIETEEGNNCVAAAATIQLTRPDLIEIDVSNPPARAKPGDGFRVTDTAKNLGKVNAAASTTRYYLSLDGSKSSDDKQLSGSRSVPLLAPGGAPGDTNTGERVVTIPTGTTLGTYFLLACADDPNAVIETSETNNCVPSTTTVVVTRPDLVESAVSEPPANATPGSSFTVSDTTKNNSVDVSAGASTTRYYLSLDGIKDGGDKLLSGNRGVPLLTPDPTPGATNTGTRTVTIPTSAVAGSYFLLACADDTKVVTETNETNNCKASTGKVTVGP
jgi:glucose/arabinose dehydrogenase/subtilase family serine protease